MPAVSKAQQRFMGMVYATKKGEMTNPSPEVKKAASSMNKKDAKDFAGTKHKGLPNKVEEESKKCQLGYYYCYTDKKCKPIPKGFKVVGRAGMLRKENGHTVDDDDNKNGNGNGNGKSANAFDSYAESLSENGSLKLALKNYQKAVEIAIENDDRDADLFKKNLEAFKKKLKSKPQYFKQLIHTQVGLKRNGLRNEKITVIKNLVS